MHPFAVRSGPKLRSAAAPLVTTRWCVPPGHELTPGPHCLPQSFLSLSVFGCHPARFPHPAGASLVRGVNGFPGPRGAVPRSPLPGRGSRVRDLGRILGKPVGVLRRGADFSQSLGLMQEAWGSRRRKRTHIKGGRAGRRGTRTGGEGAAGHESEACPSVTSKTLLQA